MSQKNSEVKIAIDVDKARQIREKLQATKAKFQGTDTQVDTYFNVEAGRLKLRSGSIENCLVYYDRVELEGAPKTSHVKLVQLEKNQITPVREMFSQSNGVLVEVFKLRSIWLLTKIGNGCYIKFHLDVVDDLGFFVEIEVIDQGGDADIHSMNNICNEWIDHFGLNKEDAVAKSYSDMLLDWRSLLKKDGWSIDCESPLEISDLDGSRATGRAAKMVIDSLLS